MIFFTVGKIEEEPKGTNGGLREQEPTRHAPFIATNAEKRKALCSSCIKYLTFRI